MHNNKPFNKRFPFKQIFIYAVMTIAVCVTVSLVTLFMLGYRIDTDKRNLEQYAFLQFSSSPSGATISVNGAIIGGKTPSKTSVRAGKNSVVIWRGGYEKWRKTVTVKSGTLTWLNYALLVPKDPKVSSIVKYTSIYSSLASSKSSYMIIQPVAGVAGFDLIDLGSDKIKSTRLTLPANLYTQAAGSVFKLEKWSDNERYVIISHKYSNKQEWLVVDTQNLTQSKNITKLFDLTIKQVNFASGGGNDLYVLDSGSDIRKLDLSAATISKPLISNVEDYNVYNKLKIVTYTGSNGKASKNQRVAGIYRDGDETPSVMKTVSASNSTPLHIATTNYFSDNYVAISYGNKVEIFSGSYPNTTSDNTNSMKLIESFKSKVDVKNLSFSPTGKYLLVQSDAYFASYDLEYRHLAESSIDGNGSVLPVKWLDDNHIWSDRNGKLVIREFDGANLHTINSVVQGQDAALTSNGRFLYSIGTSKGGFQLQRVRMILP